jgi:Na+/pantothenate symporter
MGLFFAVPFYRRQLTTLADFFRQRSSGAVEKIVVFIMAPASILRADVITDLLQGIVLIAGLCLLLGALLLGAPDQVRQAWQELEPGRLNLFPVGRLGFSG